MNSEWMILSYSQNGTLPDLPRDHLIDGLFECRWAVRTVGTVQICILPISHRHDVEDLYFYLSSGF